jgi:hypothetical protein
VSPRETVDAKANRYLAECRVTVELADLETVHTSVRVWRCDCRPVAVARIWPRSGS